MCYTNTFIMKAEDCQLANSAVPSERNGKPTVASIEYALISSNPYTYTQEDVQFLTYLTKNQLEETEEYQQFLSGGYVKILKGMRSRRI